MSLGDDVRRTTQNSSTMLFTSTIRGKESAHHLFRIESGKLRESVFLYYVLLMKPVWEYIVEFALRKLNVSSKIPPNGF